MITLTERLDKALRTSSWAHEQAGEHRKGGDIPYIIHPFGVMIIASEVTDNEDTLIACLLHDILEDVPSHIYDEHKMITDFGENVTSIVKDVSKDMDINDWREASESYLKNLETKASDEAIIVSASDKIHNVLSTIIDYEKIGDDIWDIFTTKNVDDQLWWYDSILNVLKQRSAPTLLVEKLNTYITKLRKISNKS